MNAFKFELIHSSKRSRARIGKIHTPHGVIDTPNFVGVGTNGTLKALDNAIVHEVGLQLMFCNTYHLLVQPGTEIVRKAGGLHRFINRNLPIITDSGGFQVFSLAYGSVADELKSHGKKKQNGLVIKISEEGVLFRSYRDGSKILLTPETSIAAQKDLGADIIIPFDELPPYHIASQQLKSSLERTHRWEERSLQEHLKNPQGQAIYAVVHGGIDIDLRKKSAEFLTPLAFDGFAVGAGCNLALACDLIIASDRAKFGQVFSKVGLIPDSGGSYFLPRLVGLAKAKELVFTADLIDAQEALRIGLVNRVVQGDRLLAEGEELTGKIVAGPPKILARAKELLNRSLGMDLTGALRAEAEGQAFAMTTEDHQEGLRAFFERRPPKFTGR